MIISADAATTTLTGVEEQFTFEPIGYRYASIANLGTENIKISRTSDISSKSDGVGVIELAPGGSVSITTLENQFYALGNGPISIIGSDSAQNSFKLGGKGGGGGSGTTNYEMLTNKPSIEGTVLTGDKTWEELGLPEIPDVSDMVSNPNAESILTGSMSATPTVSSNGINVALETNILNSSEKAQTSFNIGLVNSINPGLISPTDKTIIDSVLPAEASIPENATDEKIPTSKAVQLYVLAKLTSMGFKPIIVPELPETGESNRIYLVPRINGITGDNIHDEYLWVNNRFELLASTGIDLSDYVTKQFLIDYIASHTDAALSSTSENPVQNKVVSAALSSAKNYTDEKIGDLNTELSADISDKLDKTAVSSWALAPTKPSYTSTEVGADPKGSANAALSSAKNYTDEKIGDLVGGAPSTLDTIYEIAAAIQNNQTVVTALNNAIVNKVDKSDIKSSVPDSPTDTQILSAKLVKDLLAGKLDNKGRAVTDKNLNWDTLTNTGIYTIGFNDGVTSGSNGPTGASGWGILFVLNTGVGTISPACLQQLYITAYGTYSRLNWGNSSGWSAWIQRTPPDLSNYVTKSYLSNMGVTGIKGKAETSYRHGNVNITAENLGLHIESTTIGIPNTNSIIETPITFTYTKPFTSLPAATISARSTVQSDATDFRESLNPSSIKISKNIMDNMMVTLRASHANGPPYTFSFILMTVD